MGRRKADSKHLEHLHDVAEKRRVDLERELQEDRQRERRRAAAWVGAGTYLTVRGVQQTVNFSAKVPDLAELRAAIEAILEGSLEGIPDSIKKFLNADPLALGMALFCAGMILVDLNPGEILVGLGEIVPL